MELRSYSENYGETTEPLKQLGAMVRVKVHSNNGGAPLGARWTQAGPPSGCRDRSDGAVGLGGRPQGDVAFSSPRCLPSL